MPARADRALYSATLDLAGASVLVVGAGAVAFQKLKGLPRGLKRVRVVAPRFLPALRVWAGRRPEVELISRSFEAGDLRGCRIVFCCAGDADANRAAAALARSKGLWVCQAEAPEQGDLQVPALVRAGGLLLTLSTGGASPALAKALRARFEAELKASDLRWLLGRLRLERPRMKADPVYKARLLKRLAAPAALAAALAPRSARRRRRLEALLKP